VSTLQARMGSHFQAVSRRLSGARCGAVDNKRLGWRTRAQDVGDESTRSACEHKEQHRVQPRSALGELAARSHADCVCLVGNPARAGRSVTSEVRAICTVTVSSGRQHLL